MEGKLTNDRPDSAKAVKAELLEEDDDAGDGLNARITRVLDAGMYTIEATTRYGNVTGPFTLSVTAEEN